VWMLESDDAGRRDMILDQPTRSHATTFRRFVGTMPLP
jgi:hypothetical protein